MYLTLLLLIPIVLTEVWAFYTKVKERKYYDIKVLSLLTTAVAVNVVLVYETIHGDVSVWEQMLQMAASVTIVPLTYLYFARQVGTQESNRYAMSLMWLFGILAFIPNIIIYNPFEPFVLPDADIKPYVVYFISHGEKSFYIGTADLMIMLQTIVGIHRIASFMRLLKRHNLHLNRKVYVFGIYWAVTIVFIFIMSNMLYEDLRTPAGQWFYYSMYSLLIVSMNVLIAMHYDNYPIESEQGEVVENLTTYLQSQFGVMANKVRHIVETERLFRDPHFSSERMIEMLGTNRTYFAKMMTTEFGMTFSEYLNSLRYACVKELLKDSSLSMTEIAVKSGYNDSNYMSRKFKEKEGVTPSAWRKNYTE